MDYFETHKGILDDAGPPTARSLEYLRHLELDCENRKDPNSFYLTFTINNPLSISWAHNADRHLGVSDLDSKQYFDHIHPVWLPLHLGFGAAAYFILRTITQNQPEVRTIYTINVPVRHVDGTYHWYNQVSFPAAFDDEGRLVSHLNHYHRLCAFDSLVPTKPFISVNDVLQDEYSQDFARAGNASLFASLTGILSPANYRILQTYRELTIAKDGKWITPAKKVIREKLGLSATAINKANVRIIQAVKGKFPDSVTHDVASFSTFLNDLCGQA